MPSKRFAVAQPETPARNGHFKNPRISKISPSPNGSLTTARSEAAKDVQSSQDPHVLRVPAQGVPPGAAAPSPNGGREANGRLAKGNPGGTGNPFARPGAG